MLPSRSGRAAMGSRGEEGRAWQGQAGQGKAKAGRTGPGKAKPSQAEPGKAGQKRSEPARADPSRAGPGSRRGRARSSTCRPPPSARLSAALPGPPSPQGLGKG